MTYLFEQELDFTDRLPFDHYPRYAAQYLKAWRAYWRDADLFDGLQPSKANLLYKRACQIAIEYGLRMSVQLDEHDELEITVKFPFPIMLSSFNPDLKRLCNAMLVCDEFSIMPQSPKEFDLIFTLHCIY